VEDTENIREAFAGAVGGLTSIVAQAVELLITGQVPLKDVHTPFAMRRISETSVAITIPDLFAGERRDVLVELSVPAGDDARGQATLLQAHVRYTDLRSGSVVQTAPVVMETSWVDDPQPEAEPDEEVSAQRERVEVTRALKQASVQSDMGQFEAAQHMLDVADKRMKGKRAKTAMSEALCSELTDAKCRMKSRMNWEAGGRAEVHDAVQMHTMQRATNMAMSSSCAVSKSSKKMYCNSRQETFMSRSKNSTV